MVEKIGYGVAFAIILSLAGYVIGLNSEISELKEKNAEQRATIVDFERNETRFLDTIKEQNESIEHYHNLYEEMKKEAKELKEEREELQEQFEDKLSEIDDMEIGGSCEESMNFLREAPNSEQLKDLF